MKNFLTKPETDEDVKVYYIHSKGLKIGIYSSAGRFTCSGFLPGSLGHEKTDVEMLVDWEMDYFKYDNWPTRRG